MRCKSLCVAVLTLLAMVALNHAWAQGPGVHGPRLFGSWQPKVGSGAAYRIDSKAAKQSTEWEWSIVGTEKVGAESGYWLEMYGRERGGQSVVMKQLIVWRAGEGDIQRMIFQSGDEPPMEMSAMMRRQPGQAQKDVRQTGRKVGTESVTTPAGTFTCEHWQSAEPEGTSDIWLSKDVAPFGLVKSVSANSTVILTRIITNAQSRIKGQPRSMEEMMREHRQQ